MTVFHFAAPAVEQVAQPLIARHHPHLRGLRIEYVFRSEVQRSNGKLVFGKARKVTGLNALLATPDQAHDPDGSSDGLAFFVLETAWPLWQALDEAQKNALVDHELCHMGIEYGGEEEDEISLVLRPHELEEFAAVLRRHGLYRPDVAGFFRAVGDDRLNLWAQGIPGDEDLFGHMIDEDENKVVQGPWPGEVAR